MERKLYPQQDVACWKGDSNGGEIPVEAICPVEWVRVELPAPVQPISEHRLEVGRRSGLCPFPCAEVGQAGGPCALQGRAAKSKLPADL